MISETAMADIETLEAEGFRLSARDIVRLNALGLRLEAAKKKNPLDACEYLPRVARLGKALFRQPTLGHEIWMDRVSQIVDFERVENLLAVRAYALSREAADLPNPDNESLLRDAVQAFSDTFIEYTRDQIAAALDYVENGADETVGEYAPLRQDESEDAAFEREQVEEADWQRSCALGVLREGQAVLFGVPREELERMTRRHVQDLIRRAYALHDFTCSPNINRLTGDYYATKNEICERLLKERNNG